MAEFTTEPIRNVVFLGHSGSGKTSIADSMFHLASETTRLGSVTGGTSDSDFEPEEQRRQSSVTTTILPSPWRDTKINVLDAPGYARIRPDTPTLREKCYARYVWQTPQSS
jgi:elongation factor G